MGRPSDYKAKARTILHGKSRQPQKRRQHDRKFLCDPIELARESMWGIGFFLDLDAGVFLATQYTFVSLAQTNGGYIRFCSDEEECFSRTDALVLHHQVVVTISPSPSCRIT